MTLQEAAEILDLPKKKLWRAVKAENLKATKKQVGNRWEYRVSREAVRQYQREYLESGEFEAIECQTGSSHPGTTDPERNDLHAKISELEETLQKVKRDYSDLEQENILLRSYLEASREEVQTARKCVKQARELINTPKVKRKRLFSLRSFLPAHPLGS